MTRDVAPSGAPFLIGITGKRDLKGQEDAVRAALDGTFDIIDARLPHSPKILLSALAKGADTVAAEAALARPGWRVVAPLPFEREVYEGDFPDPASLARLRSLMADPRRQGHPAPRPAGRARPIGRQRRVAVDAWRWRRRKSAGSTTSRLASASSSAARC